MHRTWRDRPTDIRGAGQSGERRGAGGAKGACPSGGDDSSGGAKNDAGGRRTVLPSPTADRSDDQMEVGEGEGRMRKKRCTKRRYVLIYDS